VVAAGALRLCVVRAIRDASQPTAVAEALRRIVGVAPGG
jgi:thiamine monophosphate synthase